MVQYRSRREIIIKNYSFYAQKHEFDALARAILPAIVQLFETEEGQKGFEEWRKGRRKQKEKQFNNKNLIMN